MFLFISILIILFTSLQTITEAHVGPSGLDVNETITCKEFSKFARFNPYSVLNDKWFVFYYWGPSRSNTAYSFLIPGKSDIAYLHKILDGHVPKEFNWTSTLVLLNDHGKNISTLLVKRGDRGEYWHYDLYSGIPKGDILRPIDIRIKQTGDNRFIGIMMCKSKLALVMSRLKDVPSKKELQDSAARIGYRGRGGKSYLYQGGEWMPIAEYDEKEFWQESEEKDFEQARLN